MGCQRWLSPGRHAPGVPEDGRERPGEGAQQAEADGEQHGALGLPAGGTEPGGGRVSRGEGCRGQEGDVACGGEGEDAAPPEAARRHGWAQKACSSVTLLS